MVCIMNIFGDSLFIAILLIVVLMIYKDLIRVGRLAKVKIDQS